MHNLFKFLVLSLISTIAFSSCSTPLEKIDYNNLIGSWKLVKAVQDGEVTERLEGITISFKSGGKVSSNLFELTQLPAEMNYNLKGNEIITGADEVLKFTIAELKEQHLLLNTKLLKFDFELHFDKIN